MAEVAVPERVKAGSFTAKRASDSSMEPSESSKATSSSAATSFDAVDSQSVSSRNGANTKARARMQAGLHEGLQQSVAASLATQMEESLCLQNQTDSTGAAKMTLANRSSNHPGPESLTGNKAGEYDHSELSVGAASLDGKSVTSGMTFAMDEKESLRPDDSASVKAFDEEDTLSIAGSTATESKLGSETGGKAFRAQFHEISARMGSAKPQTTESLNLPPQPTEATNTDAGEKPARNGTAPTEIDPAAIVSLPPGFTRQDPDEKLVEALDSPKDRLFILKLEQEVIEFVKDSREKTLDLPPTNSFHRMLIHKMADYYFLTQFVDPTTTSVRLYRTPFCRLPPPLTGISNPPTSESTPPPNAPSVKIMRRGNIDRGYRPTQVPSSTATSSDGQSKPTSEAGFEDSADLRNSLSRSSTDQGSLKDKANLTREQREAKYKEARERIFGDANENESEVSADKDKEISRSSSAAGKKKGNGKRQRQPKDDSFEARSQFLAYYHGPPYGNTPGSENFHYAPGTQQMPHARPSGTPVQGQQSPVHYSYQQQPMPPEYPFQNSQWTAGYGQTPMNAPPQYFHYTPIPGQTYQTAVTQGAVRSVSFPNQSTYPPSYSASPSYQRPTSQQSNPQWNGQQQQQFYNPAASQGHQYFPNQYNPNDGRSYSPGPLNPSQYAYGQLPNPGYPQRAQHPIPGSYNRNNFNPQSQNFAPNHSFGPNGPGTQVGPVSSYGPMPYPPQLPNNPSSHLGFTGRPNQPGDQFHGAQAMNQSIFHSPQRQQSYPYTAPDRAYGQSTSHGSISNWSTPASLPAKPNFTNPPPLPKAPPVSSVSPKSNEPSSISLPPAPVSVSSAKVPPKGDQRQTRTQ